MKNPFKLIPLVLALCSLPAAAGRIALTIFLDSPAGAPDSAVLVSEKGLVEITLPKRNLSQEFDLPGGDLMLAALSSHPKDGEPIPKNAPTVRIPESWDRCILLFFPDPSNDTFPVRIIPVNASQAVFPLGKTLVFNLSDARLIASFGGKQSQHTFLRTGNYRGPDPGVRLLSRRHRLPAGKFRSTGRRLSHHMAARSGIPPDPIRGPRRKSSSDMGSDG